MRDSLILLQSLGWAGTSLGIVPGLTVINKAGRNAVSAAGEDIWEGSSPYTGFPVGNAGETVEVFSSSAADIGFINISGLDADWNDQTETIAVNGTTPVTSARVWQRVHTGNFNKTGSSTAFNAGTITVRHSTTTANVFLQMLAGRSQTNSMVYTVPAGRTAVMMHLEAWVRRGQQGINLTPVAVDLDVWYREFGKSPRLRRPYLTEGGMRYDEYLHGGLTLPEKTDITARVSALTTTDQDLLVSMDILVAEPEFLGYW